MPDLLFTNLPPSLLYSRELAHAVAQGPGQEVVLLDGDLASVDHLQDLGGLQADPGTPPDVGGVADLAVRDEQGEGYPAHVLGFPPAQAERPLVDLVGLVPEAGVFDFFDLRQQFL